MSKTVSSGCWSKGFTRPQVPLKTLQSSKYIWGNVFCFVPWNPGINSVILVSVDSRALASVLLGNWSIFLKVWISNCVVNFCESMCFNGTGIEVSTRCKSCNKHEHSAPRSKNSDAPHSAPSSKWFVLSHVLPRNKLSEVCNEWTQTWWQDLSLWICVQSPKCPFCLIGILWFHQDKIIIMVMVHTHMFLSEGSHRQ